ncbi:hypothetical protein ABZU32_20375 [Sphaerisporangium sp. NPDC005288]|uniref:hypothetical protein n=1 Tax=Sphaerisporangium sp. NPDC005288 TaxID=3155114 RepID=UPI0033BC5D72
MTTLWDEAIAKAQKEQAANENLLEVLRARAVEGDPTVTAVDLAEQEANIRFAEVLVERARRDAANAKRAGLDVKATQLRDRARELVEHEGTILAQLIANALSSLVPLVDYATTLHADTRQTISDLDVIGHQIADLDPARPSRADVLREHLNIAVGTDSNGHAAITLFADGDQAGRVLRAVRPERIIGALIELVLDPDTAQRILKDGHVRDVFTALPATADAIGLTPEDAGAFVRGNPGRNIIAARVRDHVTTNHDTPANRT